MKYDITLTKGFIPRIEEGSINFDRIQDIHRLVSSLKESNVFLDIKTVEYLFECSDSTYNEIIDNLYSYFRNISAKVLRQKFSSTEDVSKEFLSKKEEILQVLQYVFSYGLNINPNFLEELYKDDINLNDIKEFEFPKKSRVITIKHINDVIDDITRSSIVFGDYEKTVLTNFSSFIDTSKVNTKIKENSIFIANLTKDYSSFKTANDILRLAIYFSTGSVEIQECKFKLSTSQKKIIMRLLNNVKEWKDEVKPRLSNWKGLFTCIQPLSKKYSKYTRAQNIFSELRSTKLRSTMSDFNMLNPIEQIDLLSKKPGELLRNLDFLIRSSNNVNYLCKILSDLKLNPKLALQVSYYIKSRKVNIQNRIFNVKGKLHKSDKNLEPLNKDNVKKVRKVLKDKLIEHLASVELF